VPYELSGENLKQGWWSGKFFPLQEVWYASVTKSALVPHLLCFCIPPPPEFGDF